MKIDAVVDRSPRCSARRTMAKHVCCLEMVGVLILALAVTSLAAQTSTGQRPRILGIAHAAIYVSDLNKSRPFYESFLGFDEPFSLKRPDGTEWVAFIKVNDQQYLELFSGNSANAGHVGHFALYTDDAATLREYLVSRGIVPVDQLHKGQTGDLFFTIKDPDGHFVEFVQSQSTGWIGQAKGKFMPLGRASDHISHVGILVGAIGPATTFYRDVLGMQEVERTSDDGKQSAWIDLRVPEGNDYVELIQDPQSPSPEQHRRQNHVSFTTSNLQKTVAALQSKAKQNSYGHAIDIQTGSNQRRLANLFDPDGARIEIMEPKATGTLVSRSPASTP